jgi:hypothetical protein
MARAGAICGDLNGDGLPRIGDALILLQTVADPPGAPTLCNDGGGLQCGDMNGDGTLTISDVVIFLNYLVGNPTLFPICTSPGPAIACMGSAGVSKHAATDGDLQWTGQATRRGNIVANEVWPEGCRVNVDGFVFVEPQVTLTIQPGAIVAGVHLPTTGSSVSALAVLRGGKIVAAGTPTRPIVMTSDDHLDTDGGGHIADWGGLTINGNAPVNCPTGECLAEGFVGVPFGGPDPNDFSGVVRYVRVEFGGYDLGDNLLRNISLNGVGANTVYDHVQSNVGFDDCQAWDGGTVNGKFLVSSGCGDDLFDTQLATTGRFQYLLGLYYEPILQDLGNHGFEWDNNENGFDLLPRNAPIVCNATLIGTNLQPSVGLGRTERAANLRRGTSGRISNTILEHFRSAGLKLDDNATANQACDPGPVLKPGGLVVDHSLLFDNGTDTTGGPHFGNVESNWSTTSGPPGSPLGNCTGTGYWNLITAGGTVSPTAINATGDPSDPGEGLDPGIVVKYGLGLSDSQTDLGQFVPTNHGAPGFPLVTALAGDCHALDPFFDATGYIGAFDPTKPSWLTSPWISFELQ